MQKHDAGATMEKLLDAAAQLFDNKGYFNVSIKEIGLTAGCNSALISYYFGSKQKLYQAVVLRQLDFLQQVKETVSAMGLSPLEKIKQYFLRILESQLDPHVHVNILYQEILHPSGLITEEPWQKIFQLEDYVHSLLEKALTSGQLRPPNKGQDYHYIPFILTSITEMLFLLRDRLTPITPENRPKAQVLLEIIEFVLAPYLSH